jgi:hypothetical protein
MCKSLSKVLFTALIVLLVGLTTAQAKTAKNAFVTLENRDGVLNVRTVPVDGKVIGYLGDGRAVSVIDTLDGWALVCYPYDLQNPLGWVCMDYLHIYGGDIEYETEEKQ